jgi:arsenate reductase (glutaredoxin)
VNDVVPRSTFGGSRCLTQAISTILLLVAKLPFYTKPSCTTCRNARSFIEEAGVELEPIDINLHPPSRAFLEEHVDDQRFLDFVSTRSPVFKTRPFPTSKQEAIDLMLEQPNLIKRPVLIRGQQVIFGFDKRAYATAGIGRRA